MDKSNQIPAVHSAPLTDSQALRAQAEALHNKRTPRATEEDDNRHSHEMQGTLHELRVHQIELEMQNDELRRIQSELDSVRAHYFDLYDLAPVGYCTTTKACVLLQANLTATVMLGIPREELTGKPFTRYICREDRDIFYILNRHLAELGQTQHCELRMIRRDGTLFWVSMDATTVLNQQMEPEIRIVLIDITERRQSQLQLEVSNANLTRTKIELETANLILIKTRQQLWSFIQHAPVSIAMFDMNMKYLACSDGWLRDFGQGRAGLIGSSYYEIHPNLPGTWREQHELGLAGATLKDNEDIWENPDGSRYWLRWSLQPWLDEHAETGGIIISAENITERKLQEVKLIENEQRLNGFFESAMDAIISVNEAYRIVLFNPSAEKMFGIAREQAIGAELDIIIPPRFHARHRLHVENFGTGTLKQRGMSRSNAVVGLRADGEEFPMEATISYVDADYKKLYTVVIRDRTLQKRAEDEIRQYQEQLRGLIAHQQQIKEEERIRIAREIHDELGSTLTGVKANLSVALHEAVTLGQTPKERLLDANKLLDQAVDTVRKVITELRPSVLDQLGIWAALEWYARQFEARSGIHCHVELGDAVAGTVLDPERSTAVFRVTQESLTNVMRHARATEVHIGIDIHDGVFCMEIEDNGVGIDQSRIEGRQAWGITGMIERARFLGGTITISDTSHGTLLSLRLPLEAGAAP